MSSSETNPLLRRISRRGVLVMLPLALGACGFTAVYAPGGTGSTLRGNVTVNEPGSRSAFLLTRRLEETLGRSVQPAYRLNVSVSSRTEGLAFSRAGSITRYNLIGTADYALVEVATGQVMMSGDVENFTGYSATGTNVATLAARRDAEQRVMVLLADQITTRLLASDLS
ncbi:LPS assembly lipoprotein LptE [uncultured Roseobacter sp.]|uniref:LPS assembly lipoprotein LptE n=1 Tax=uncultured Roseobacter sp. TaxID=114847 RepID=UPI00262032FC|nr:LPS assembly lipoprotein LptE [uncultured Roseobacter sp.]